MKLAKWSKLHQWMYIEQKLRNRLIWILPETPWGSLYRVFCNTVVGLHLFGAYSWPLPSWALSRNIEIATHHLVLYHTAVVSRSREACYLVSWKYFGGGPKWDLVTGRIWKKNELLWIATGTKAILFKINSILRAAAVISMTLWPSATGLVCQFVSIWQILPLDFTAI